MEFRPEDMEPLRFYNFLSNDDDEILLKLPGYFKGDALEPKFYYSGGKHAILLRNKYQRIICDEIHPEIRKLIPKNKSILVYESDTRREYLAEIVDEDINKVTDDACRMHRYDFDYHPFPVIDETFDIGEEKCSFCKKNTKIFYKAAANNKQYIICPHCIENAIPANNAIDLYPEMDETCIELDKTGEVFMMNPPALRYGQPINTWGIHCGRLGVYLGQLEVEDLSEEVRENLELTWDNEKNIYKDMDPKKAFEKFKNDECTCHLFRCMGCNEVFCIFIK